MVWSLFVGSVFLPDEAFNRLLVIALPFLLLFQPSLRQWVAMWVVSSVAALAAVVATRGVPHALHPIAGVLRSVFSHEATVPHVLWMNLLPALILAFYFIDRRARSRAASSARSNALAIAS